jgi:hypothetical protein
MAYSGDRAIVPLFGLRDWIALFQLSNQFLPDLPASGRERLNGRGNVQAEREGAQFFGGEWFQGVAHRTRINEMHSAVRWPHKK